LKTEAKYLHILPMSMDIFQINVLDKQNLETYVVVNIRKQTIAETISA
jgi:hypothetical protein